MLIFLLFFLRVSTVRGLEVISLGSDVDDVMASDLDFESSNDFEISLSDVGLNAPEQRSFSPIHEDDFD